ncbi:MAG TPA: response regulator [Burkholderiales bacterium]|nr:response regulator [Burkholderiales bacterium]
MEKVPELKTEVPELKTEVPGLKPAPDILVIDDDDVMRELVADWLQSAGYRVRTAADCAAGVEQVKRQVPDAIVSDMFMPGPCGIAAIEALKRCHPQVGLIALSGHFNSGQGLSAEAAEKAGAARAIAKPCKRSELLRAVAELVGVPAATA